MNNFSSLYFIFVPCCRKKCEGPGETRAPFDLTKDGVKQKWERIQQERAAEKRRREEEREAENRRFRAEIERIQQQRAAERNRQNRNM